MKAKRHNKGKRKWSLVDWKSLEAMVEVLEYGRDKYSEFEDNGGGAWQGYELSQEERENLTRTYDAADNWKKGFNGLENMESAARHLVAYMSGNKTDDESGLPHLGHLMCCVMFQLYHDRDNGEGLKSIGENTMDFKQRLIEELNLTDIQSNTLLKDYVLVCEKLAKEYHKEQLIISGIVSTSKLN